MNADYIIQTLTNALSQVRTLGTPDDAVNKAVIFELEEAIAHVKNGRAVDAQLVRDYFEAQAACDALNMIKQPSQFREAAAHLEEAQNALWDAAGMERPR